MDPYFSGSGQSSPAQRTWMMEVNKQLDVIRRLAAKRLNVAKRAHYDGRKQTKLTSFFKLN